VDGRRGLRGAPRVPACTEHALSRFPELLATGTPHDELHGTITPSDLHYERHHGGVPEIDAAHYTLLMHGLVERPTIFTLDDLKRLPAESRICFLECSGN
jgi:sulfane dehydrogenase subunit SoxC